MPHKTLKANGPKSYGCTLPDCGKSFGSLADLKRHWRIKSHRDERPFACGWPGCGRAFPQSAALRNHINTHTGAKPYKCGWWPVCKRAFGDKSTCSRHEFTKHLGLVGHKCPVKSCTSSIKRPTDFARHLREKHCIDPKGLDITQFAVYKPGGGPVKKRRKCRSVVSSPDNSLLSCPLDDFTEAGSTSSSSVTPLPETPEMSVQPELLPIELPQIESQPSFVSQQHGLQIGDFFFPDSFEKFDFAPQPQLTITPIVPQAESAQSYPSAGDSLAFDFVSCIDPALMDNAYGGQSQQYFAYPAYLGYHTSFH